MKVSLVLISFILSANAFAECPRMNPKLSPDLNIAVISDLTFFGVSRGGDPLYVVPSGTNTEDIEYLIARMMATGWLQSKPEIIEEKASNQVFITARIKSLDEANRDTDQLDSLLLETSPELALAIFSGLNFVGMSRKDLAVFSIPATIPTEEAMTRLISSGLIRSLPEQSVDSSGSALFKVKVVTCSIWLNKFPL